MLVEKRESLARAISNIINPFMVSCVVIIVLVISSTASSSEAIKWSAILIAVNILPVFMFVLYLVGNRKLDGIFVSSRQQRRKIYMLASACAVIGCFLLFYLEAPLVLTTTFIAGLVAIVIFMGINHWWKISLHMAFLAGSVAVLIISFGSICVVTAVLLPPVAWARIELKYHSPMQVTAGALLAVIIVVAVFAIFGLIGNGA